MKPTSASELLRQHKLEAGLAGYPVAALLDDFLASPVRPQQQRQVILFVLDQWATRLWRDLGELPPVETDLVRDVRDRMLRSREALLGLRDAVMQL